MASQKTQRVTGHILGQCSGKTFWRNRWLSLKRIIEHNTGILGSLIQCTEMKDTPANSKIKSPHHKIMKDYSAKPAAGLRNVPQDVENVDTVKAIPY